MSDRFDDAMISNLKQIGENLLRWDNGNESVEISVRSIQSALVDSSGSFVFVICKIHEQNNFIIQFESNGKEHRRINPPDGYTFYYMSPHFKAPISVVCQGPMDDHGRTDYHFGINPKTGTLKLIGLAH